MPEHKTMIMVKFLASLCEQPDRPKVILRKTLPVKRLWMLSTVNLCLARKRGMTES